jgi:hypothetical protein
MQRDFFSPTNTITAAPEISSPDCLEIRPAWLHDCKVLFFCSAPKKENFEDTSVAGLAHDKIKYDLMRIAYYAVSRVWGETRNHNFIL